MPATPAIKLDPKRTFLTDRAKASAHADVMASPSFREAAASALLHYQIQCAGGDPQVLALAMSKLRGAQEFLHILMNLGTEEPRGVTPTDDNLSPPEERLSRLTGRPGLTANP